MSHNPQEAFYNFAGLRTGGSGLDALQEFLDRAHEQERRALVAARRARLNAEWAKDQIEKKKT